MRVGDKIKIKKFDGYGVYGGCYWKIINRYVKEIGDDYIIVNYKSDFSGKDLKIKYNSDNYIILNN